MTKPQVNHPDHSTSKSPLRSQILDVAKFSQRKLVSNQPVPLKSTSPDSIIIGRSADTQKDMSPLPAVKASAPSPKLPQSPSLSRSSSLSRVSSLSRASSLTRSSSFILSAFKDHASMIIPSSKTRDDDSEQQKLAPPRPPRPESSWYDEDKDILDHLIASYCRKLSTDRALEINDSNNLMVNVHQRQVFTNYDESRRPSAVSIYDPEADDFANEDHDIGNLPKSSLMIPASPMSFESDISSASSSDTWLTSPPPPPPPPKAPRPWIAPPRSFSLRHSGKSQVRHERKISEEPDDVAAYEQKQAMIEKVSRQYRVSREMHGRESPLLGAAAFI
ncbi:hypothetical protein V1512DRAFT_63634 [Lipomyces arxii]|uniref:uncharacterized protein n=1 Tax=Lipomyces arxii TaxID=56418 RepID=UPI0034CE1985